jgi:hypothetical protein
MAGTIVSDTIQNGAGTSTSTTNVINGCAKAWARWDSNGTVAGSYNVSSVTRTATGNYTVNLTTALPNTNCAFAGSANEFAGSFNGGQRVAMAYVISTSQIGACFTYMNGGPADCPYNSLIIFSA